MLKNTVKLVLIGFVILFVSGCDIINTPTDTTSTDPSELVVDPNCSALLFTDPDADCNILCKYECIAKGQGCPKDEPETCKDVEQTNPIVRNSVNFSGINFGPPERAIPNIIRMILLAVMGLVSAAAIIMGLYGMVVRTTAGENPEKVQESAKIFQNAIIGVVISVLGILVIQIIVLLLGITQNLFDFNFVPTELTDSSFRLECGEGSIGYRDVPPSDDPDGVGGVRNYICRDGSWEPYNTF